MMMMMMMMNCDFLYQELNNRSYISTHPVLVVFALVWASSSIIPPRLRLGWQSEVGLRHRRSQGD